MLMEQNLDKLANSAAREAGKTVAEARAGVLKGIEVVRLRARPAEPGHGRRPGGEPRRHLRVQARAAGRGGRASPRSTSRRWCRCGCSPSRSRWATPSSSSPPRRCRSPRCMLGELMLEAGVPPGVFSIVHGGKEAVEGCWRTRTSQAVAFVGSTAVAQARVHGGHGARQAGAGAGRREEPPHRRAGRGPGVHAAGGGGLVHRVRGPALHGGQRAWWRWGTCST